MPVTMTEASDSRRRTINKNGSVELRYFAFGSNDDQDIVDHALANIPSTYADLPHQETVVQWLGDGKWEVLARYAPNSASNQSEPVPPPEEGDNEFEFDTTGGTQHITQAKETIATYPDPAIGVASDWQEAIGVTDDGVQGIDIVLPQFSYKETHQIAHATVVGGLTGVIYGLTAKVNNASFKGFAAGEVLFVGATGRRRKSEGFWTITFNFLCSRNATGIPIGPITVTSKKGWEHLDVQYESAEDETASMLVKKPIAARVYRVYDSGDFSTLGIGT
jgi:hypothetical protein